MGADQMTVTANRSALPATREATLQPTRHTRSWVAAWFALLIVVTVGVSVIAPTGWLGSDDTSYHSAAEHLLAGQTMIRAHHQFARMAMVVPVAASMWLFGDSPLTVALPNVIASALCVSLVVMIGRLLWGWWEGLCAGTVVATLPFFRVLASTGYPDIQACLWATVAVLLAIVGAQMSRRRAALAIGVGSGFALGLAASATLLSAVTVVGVIAVAWMLSPNSRRDRLTWLAAVVVGGVACLFVDGLYHLVVADDFWFKLHAVQSTRALEELYPPKGYYDAATFSELLWKRLTMILHPDTSGFGKLGMFFWPVVLAVLVLCPRGRCMAVWALATYLIVSFAPVNFKYGPKPYHAVYGRQILIACVPFALCFAWLSRRTAELAFHPSRVQRGWPVAFAAIVAVAYADPSELSGFRDRPTQRVGVALQQIIAATDWDDEREIFLPASIYWRHRILFPDELRPRLRVAVDQGAPRWWRHVSVDIVSRTKPLPGRDDAYLIATPTQLRGELEGWDYGVGLPRSELTAWQNASPLITISLRKDRTIGPVTGDADSEVPLLVLLGDPTKGARQSARVTVRPIGVESTGQSRRGSDPGGAYDTIVNAKPVDEDR